MSLKMEKGKVSMQSLHHDRVKSLITSFVASLILWVSQADVCAQVQPSEPPPNVILMMADDMGLGDTSAYQDFTGNHDDVQLDTPNMERLARMGVRFTDAHTPSSRCSPTRYGLLTGRYPWRNRLKHWVLFGSQGDPMIEPGRPTLATLFRDQGYATGMVGKWHVGLRYRRSDGLPASGWSDADITQPLHTTPLDHGFDYCRFTSRSHGTSGPNVGVSATKKASKTKKNSGKINGPLQNVGPGHIHGRIAVGATGNGKQLVSEGPDAYVLSNLGSRHSDHAIEWISEQVQSAKPFFLYYPSNSNHGPHTPDVSIDGVPVQSASRTKSGNSMNARYDYVYENDVALGRLLDYLSENNDPRNPGQKLIENTIVIFTSDNGAEINQNVASGPFRSHKGSTYEGGHRVPFLVSWKAGKVGDGDATTAGQDNVTLVGHCDLFATFAQIINAPLPNLAEGEKGAEDSFSVVTAWQGNTVQKRPPLFFHDHKESKTDHAVSAFRLDDPVVDGKSFPGQWKLFFDAQLLRRGVANPIELYDLATDQLEQNNRLDDSRLQPLIDHLTQIAALHRNSGGHRMTEFAPSQRIVLDWTDTDFANRFDGKPAAGLTISPDSDTAVTVEFNASQHGKPIPSARFVTNVRGLGIDGPGKFDQVESSEAISLKFDRDVIIDSAGLIAGNGQCGGFYRVGDHAPLAIYCIDAASDANDQSGVISDVGVLKAGESLILSSSPHYQTEPAGQWRLQSLTFRVLPK